jgi:alginate O-acetyltransferase complex protein AlgI
MLFNSLEFAFFLPIVFLLYWFVFNKNLKQQNTLLVFASYVFYGWWDWRFLSLIAFSSFIDYTVGLGLLKTENLKKRKSLLIISICVNLGFLGIFKYFNFFAESFVDAFSLFGKEIDPLQLRIILPVGISFYTFQTLSYSIDVYKKKLEPTKDIVSFLAFVSFFPQLVAGPIERATHLLPQFYEKRNFDYHKSVDGMRQILWGLVKKIIIADNCATFANMTFNNYSDKPGSVLILGAVFFAFQIYGDFSGYSDIAIGTSRLFGFDLMQNFSFPYFSRDIAEFWRRWHISLNTWFRDYLYIPLGGSRGGKLFKIRNTFIIFLVSGLWHGANWTFVTWGALNALFFLPVMLSNNNRKHLEPVAKNNSFPSVSEFIAMFSTFSMVCFAWIFFRAENLTHALSYLNGILSKSLWILPKGSDFSGTSIHPVTMFSLLFAFILIEWFGRKSQYAIQHFYLNSKQPVRIAFYYSLIAAIMVFGSFQDNQFIYFQF